MKMFEKIKDVFKRVKDSGFVRRHTSLCITLLIFACILIVVNGYKGIVWIYNDVNYGRFEKIGEIETNFPITGNNNFINLDKNNTLLFVPYKTNTSSFFNGYDFYKTYIVHSNNNKLDIYKKNSLVHGNDLLTINANNNIINMFVDTGRYKTSCTNNVVSYDFKNDTTLKKKSSLPFFIQQTSYILFDNELGLFFNRCLVKSGNDKYYSAYLYNIQNNSFKKAFDYDIYSFWPPFAINILNNKNLLIYSTNPYSYLSPSKLDIYDTRQNKLISLDTSKIDEFNGNINYRDNFRRFVWINNDRFILMSYPQLYGNKTLFNMYQIKNNKIEKNQTFTYVDIGFVNKNPISAEGYILLNNNSILFIGGELGIMWSHRGSKECYLYDLNKNKVVRINNFPFRINNQITTKMNNGIILVAGGYSDNKINKNIYKFVPGKKLK